MAIFNNIDNLTNTAATKNSTYVMILSKKTLSDTNNRLTTKNGTLLTTHSNMTCQKSGIKQKTTTKTKRVWEEKCYCWTNGYKVTIGCISLTWTKPASCHKVWQYERKVIQCGLSWKWIIGRSRLVFFYNTISTTYNYSYCKKPDNLKGSATIYL